MPRVERAKRGRFEQSPPWRIHPPGQGRRIESHTVLLATWERSEVVADRWCEAMKEKHPRERGSRVQAMRRVFIGGPVSSSSSRTLRARVSYASSRTRPRGPVRDGQSGEKGRVQGDTGESREREKEGARLRARTRALLASVDKSERRRAERTFLARLRDRQPD